MGSRATFIGVGLLSAVLSGGCATDSWSVGKEEAKIPLQMSPSASAAQGTVVIKAADQGQHKVKLDIKHLPPPELAAPGATQYVVWLLPAGQEQPYNVGVLKLNNDRKGKFEVVTAFRQFDVFVTAEPAANVTDPSRSMMLTASISPSNLVY